MKNKTPLIAVLIVILLGGAAYYYIRTHSNQTTMPNRPAGVAVSWAEKAPDDASDETPVDERELSR